MCGYLHLMKCKHESFKKFKELKDKGKKFNRQVKVFQLDHGGEYISTEFDKFLNENGIVS